MKDIAKGHIVHAFDEDLAQMRGLVLEMGEIVVGQLRDAMLALGNRDSHLADRVIERDREVYQLDLEATAQIEAIFARRQPVARDLRLVFALSKVVSELARAGNKVKKVAGYAAALNDEEDRSPGRKMLHHVNVMGDRACCMLERSLDVLSRLDVKAAIDIIQEDDELDREFDASMRHFVLKALEKVGDHANHVAQQVVFVAEGRDVRYMNPELLASRYSAD
jgi:phosphate transport system protein